MLGCFAASGQGSAGTLTFKVRPVVETQPVVGAKVGTIKEVEGTLADLVKLAAEANYKLITKDPIGLKYALDSYNFMRSFNGVWQEELRREALPNWKVEVGERFIVVNIKIVTDKGALVRVIDLEFEKQSTN
jgi:hypothetical protein